MVYTLSELREVHVSITAYRNLNLVVTVRMQHILTLTISPQKLQGVTAQKKTASCIMSL